MQVVKLQSLIFDIQEESFDDDLTQIIQAMENQSMKVFRILLRNVIRAASLRVSNVHLYVGLINEARNICPDKPAFTTFLLDKSPPFLIYTAFTDEVLSLSEITAHISFLYSEFLIYLEKDKNTQDHNTKLISHFRLDRATRNLRALYIWFLEELVNSPSKDDQTLYDKITKSLQCQALVTELSKDNWKMLRSRRSTRFSDSASAAISQNIVPNLNSLAPDQCVLPSIFCELGCLHNKPSILSLAVYYNFLPAIKKILENTRFNPQLGLRSSDGLNAPLFAIAGGHPELLTTFPILDSVFKLSQGIGAAHVAAAFQRNNYLGCLMQRANALLILEERFGPLNWTPLHYAAASNNIAAAMLFLEKGPPTLVNTPDSRGFTPLHCAAQKGCVEMIRLLLSNPVLEIDGRTEGQETAFHVACVEGSVDSVEVFLALGGKIGMDVNVKDGVGRNTLHLAAIQGHSELIGMLVKAAVDINAGDIHGRTPLMAAAEEGYLKIAQELVDAGAKVDVTDENGLTALNYAQGRALSPGSQGVVDYLMSVGAHSWK